jgi:hypothetical protein
MLCAGRRPSGRTFLGLQLHRMAYGPTSFLLSCTGRIRIRKGDLPCFASSIVHGVPFLSFPKTLSLPPPLLKPTGPSSSLPLLCHPSRLTARRPTPGAPHSCLGTAYLAASWPPRPSRMCLRPTILTGAVDARSSVGPCRGALRPHALATAAVPRYRWRRRPHQDTSHVVN